MLVNNLCKLVVSSFNTWCWRCCCCCNRCCCCWCCCCCCCNSSCSWTCRSCCCCKTNEWEGNWTEPGEIELPIPGVIEPALAANGELLISFIASISCCCRCSRSDLDCSCCCCCCWSCACEECCWCCCKIASSDKWGASRWNRERALAIGWKLSVIGRIGWRSCCWCNRDCCCCCCCSCKCVTWLWCCWCCWCWCWRCASCWGSITTTLDWLMSDMTESRPDTELLSAAERRSTTSLTDGIRIGCCCCCGGWCCPLLSLEGLRGRGPVCLRAGKFSWWTWRRCARKVWLAKKALVQPSAVHGNGLSLLCILRCHSSLDFFTKRLAQCEHSNGFSRGSWELSEPPPASWSIWNNQRNCFRYFLFMMFNKT